MRALSTSRLPNQLYITVCCMSAAARRVSVTVIAPAAFGGVDELAHHPRDGRHRRLHPLGMVDGELHRELHDRPAVVRGTLARLLRRIAPLVQPDRERAELVDRVGRRLDDEPQVVGGFAHGLLEQREQQLVLAVEVLVEAAQRLLRPVDDLLDRELGRALLVDQREGGVEEALDPLLGPGAGGVEAPRHRSLAPGRLVRRSSPGSRPPPCQNPASIFQRYQRARQENGIRATTRPMLTRPCRRGRPSSRSARPGSS